VRATLDTGSKLNYHSFMSDTSKELDNGGQGRVARRRARVRGDLLAAARRVFAERGYQDATIAEITQRADVAVGTFYLHFRDKDEIFTTLVDEVFRILRDSVVAVAARQPIEEAFPALIHALMREAYQQRDLFFILLTREGQPACLQAMRAKAGLTELLTRIIESVREKGRLADYDSTLLARLITGMVSHAITWWVEQDEPGPDSMAEHVLALLRYGLPEQLFTNHSP
jgi:AcrR family transcriptional regulator